MAPAAIAKRAVMLAIALAAGRGVASDDGRPVVVSAAVSLRDVAQDAIAAFPKRDADPELVLNTAGSGLLQRQIQQGAPVTVFLSASPAEMEALERDGLLEPGTRTDLASNRLVVVVPPDRDAPATAASLLEPGFTRLAVGNPATVPAGRYALEALESLGVGRDLEPRLVYAGDVRQVVEYVARGDVDAGVVYRTDAARFPGRLRTGPTLPLDAHTPIRYQGAVMAHAPGGEAGRRFLEFLRTEAGAAIFSRHGFPPAPPE